MAKIFPYILFFILFLNESIHTAVLNTDDNEDVMVAPSYLHREADGLRHRINSIPDNIKFSDDYFVPNLKRNNDAMPSEEEPETFYVDMNIDSDEELDTKYVRLIIDTEKN